MSKLFSSLKIKNLVFEDRIIMPPMCMYQADKNGMANRWHLVHYATRAIGGVGGIIVEATGVEPRGRITEQDLGIWSDEHIAPLKEIVDAVHEHNTRIGLQLNHAGRKSNTQMRNIAPSAIPFQNEEAPLIMSKEDIKNTVTLFSNAAKRANLAGFDFLEIHGAHGYLINQFLSPLANQRTDEYGGSLENRSCFLKEIITEIKKTWPKEKALFLRVSAEEYHEIGNHPEDVARIINNLKELGIDCIDVSSGGVLPVKVNFYPGYQLEFAKTIRTQTNLPVIGGGLVTSADMAEYALNDGCDFVYIGRELLRNPYFPLTAAAFFHEEIDWPKSYERAKIR